MYENWRNRVKRNVSLEEISDGRLYGDNDMVKADCHGCKGCYDCCTGMGDSIILDPYDIYRLQKHLGKTMDTLLLEEVLELGVVNGVILPHLKMTGPREKCVFLSGEGRCSIHESRPGLCRLFPLGRFYENGDFRYFLQTGECNARNRTKIKVSKWIDTPDQRRYHDFILKWHNMLKELEEEAEQAIAEDAVYSEAGHATTKTAVSDGTEDDKVKSSADASTKQNDAPLSVGMRRVKRKTMALLECFYRKPYHTEEDFYRQFEERVEAFAEALT